MTTKITLAEDVLRKLNSGDRSAGSNVDIRDVIAVCGQAINRILRTEYFGVTLAGEETIPEGCVLATYDNVPVVTMGNISKSKLPAMPVKLPRNMGIFRISKPADYLVCDFIPIPPGQFANVAAQRLMNGLLGQVGYEPHLPEVWYTKNLLAEKPPVATVSMSLVIMDIDRYSDYEILPINADMEGQVIREVYEIFAGKPEQVNIADSSVDRKQLS